MSPEREPMENDSNSCTAEELEQHDTVARIRWLISKLPSLQQTIIRMKDVEGYELAEIAEITGTQVEAGRVIREQLMKEL